MPLARPPQALTIAEAAHHAYELADALAGTLDHDMGSTHVASQITASMRLKRLLDTAYARLERECFAEEVD